MKLTAARMPHGIGAILALATGLALAGPAAGGALPDEPHIAVEGSHTLHVVPDTLMLSLGFVETDRDVAVASRAVEERSVRLIAALKSLDIAKADIRASDLRITPHYNWNNKEQVYTGTEVARSVKVTLRDLDRYADLVRAVIDARVGRIDRTQLSVSDEAEQRRKASQQAVQDARRRAERLIADLPVSVGSVYSISTVSGATPMRRERGVYQASAESAVAFEPGTIEIGESVRVVFLLAR